MNNGYGDHDQNNSSSSSSSWCYFHPKEFVVGICPLCLNERLLVLASKQPHHAHHSSSDNNNSKKKKKKIKKPPAINLPKMFAFGSLLNRLEFRHWKSDDHLDACSSSQEDSFISIKFEENGVASWEKQGTVSKVSLEHCSNLSWSSNSNSKDHHHHRKHNNNNNNNNIKSSSTTHRQSVIEHGKQRAPQLRWRKRIGHLLQLLRWKNNRSSKVAVEAAAAAAGGVKVTRKSWMRSLTKRSSAPPRNNNNKASSFFYN